MPPTTDIGMGLEELVALLVVVVMRGFGSGRESANKGLGELGGCTVQGARSGHCRR